ncbi:hypothetical protein KW791_00070 [Candidatus Parcubacteria bacterium]|nr:hypothetical protein [Candidatus Parcubacteria bacterium]
MPSELQLVNRVLSELGRLAVSAITDSDDAQYVAAKLSEVYPELLLDYNWNFAVVYRADNTPLSTDFSPDYIYSYQLPGDFGKFFKWAATGAQWPIYEFADGMLLAQTRPVQYYYISNQVAYTVLPPLFSRALVLYTAAKSAPTLTNNLKLSEYLEKEYEKSRIKAILQNDMERSVTTTPYNDFDRITYV